MVSDPATDELPVAVADALGLDSRAGEPVEGGRVSSFWKCSRSGQAVAVRRSPDWRTPAEVAYEWDLLRRLHGAGAPVAEPQGEPSLVAGHVWVAFGWVAGSHPGRPVADPAEYGEFLGTLHGFTVPLVDVLGQRPRWGRVDEFMVLPRDQSGLTFADTLPEFEAAMGERGRWLGRLARVVDEELRTAGVEDEVKCVAHGDFGPHQILAGTDGRFAAIIDWDFSHLDLRAADVGIGSSLARPSIDRAARMIEGYRRVGDLDASELLLLPNLRRAFHLNSLAGHVCWIWLNGHDITPALDAITERLEREQWWGPVLLEAAKAIGCPKTAPRWRASAAPRSAELSRTDLDVAHDLADRAVVVAMHFFDAGVVPEIKSDTTPVTQADRAVEILLREAINDLRPGDSVLGEEFGLLGDSNRRWLVDPIDGTRGFCRGDPNWRVQIALQEGDRMTVAIVDSPALGIRWWASEGGGAYEGDAHSSQTRRLEVSATGSLVGAIVAAYPESLEARLPDGSATVSSSPLPLVELVRGEIDAYFVDCCGPWDHAPWILLVREAGGAFTDHAGGTSPDHGGGLYSNGRIHAELLAALKP